MLIKSSKSLYTSTNHHPDESISEFFTLGHIFLFQISITFALKFFKKLKTLESSIVDLPINKLIFHLVPSHHPA